MTTFSVIPFGCKVNQYQAEIIRQSCLSFGFQESEYRQAQIVFVVGCLVTQKAQAEVLRFAKRVSGRARVIACGCAGSSPVFGEFDQIGANDINELPSVLGVDAHMVPYLSHFSGHTRALIAIQYGCDNHCSYCIVPSLRGKPRNREIDDIVSEVEKLSENGHPEVVLSGTELGHFNQLLLLLGRLASIEPLKRIRLSSINPRHLTPDSVQQILETPKVAHHLHIPLQSGSNRILGLMGRGYTTEHFMKLVDSAKRSDEYVGVTTDIIVGFPGETDSDHQQTLQLMDEVGFYRCHVFPFSPREGTKAFDMAQITQCIVSERAKVVRDLANNLAIKALCDNIGGRVSVLIEGSSRGFTGSYLQLEARGSLRRGDLVDCLVTDANDKVLIGEEC